ncbi:MAG: hypothetical protein Q8Q42_00645 [Nanoarchaeota archaeon]|nr:hypothetical protein [Nanoarchaeota archaeon]
MKTRFAITIFLALILFSSMALAQSGVLAVPIDDSHEAEAGDVATFNINITNMQDERDIYRITYNELILYPFSDFLRNIIITPDQLRLDPGESGILSVTLKIMETALQEKNYETILTVSSLTNRKVSQDVSLKTYLVSPTDAVLIFPEIPDEINPGEEYKIKIRFKNRGNAPLNNYEILISSDIPQLHKNFIADFAPKEEIIETITFQPSKNIAPGDYVVNIKVYDSKSKTRGSYSSAFTLVRSENMEEKKNEDRGFLSKTTTLTITNEGNTISTKPIESEINFFKRLFTKPEPEPIVKDGKYLWEKEISPGESFTVSYTTNYRPIFYGLIIIILSVIGMNYLIDRTVIIKKRIFKVKRTPEGLSELKVLIHVKNGKSEEITGVRIMDVLPNTMEPTDEFGTLKPTTVQQGTKGKRFIWEIGRLAPQEERILSYRVKSKVKLIGETKLPPAIVQFTTLKGKVISERSTGLSLEHTPRNHYQ